jgi:4-amino-4-deoxy-L-arabinose transferase-like glycosyltransferase
MKFSLKNIELIILAILYLFALYMWTLPIQGNGLPFGDVDASSHYTIGDYMVTHDKSIAKLPYYIGFRYGTQNSAFPGHIWYPPQYWTNTGIAQILGGDRIVSVFIVIAIFSTLIILSVYFLIRNLFGFWPAFLSSLLLIFSTRDYMVYLFGQWPQSLSFAFTPLVLYSFYAYYMKFKGGDRKNIYLYLIAVFLAAQFFFHPQGMMASIGALLVFIIAMWVKTKRIPFDIKHSLFAFLLFAAVSSALAPLSIGEFFIELVGGEDEQAAGMRLDLLFKWYQGIKNDPGLPDFYFTYNNSHGTLTGGLISWWTLPLLLIGIIALISRRSEKDWILLGWLISFYFLTRLSVIGFGSRDIRMFAYEAHVFYPIIALGLITLYSFAQRGNLKLAIKYGSIITFISLTIFINGASAYNTLNSMSNSISRINIEQYDAALWIKSNLAEDVDIYGIGTLGYQNFAAKIKWLGVLSQRHFIVDQSKIEQAGYIFLDYSDAIDLNNQDYIGGLQNFESGLQNATPIYNTNEIRIYEIDKISKK